MTSDRCSNLQLSNVLVSRYSAKNEGAKAVVPGVSICDGQCETEIDIRYVW